MKRTDSKGRLLKNGESQRKDGRYCYKYIEKNGQVKFVYSWKLVSTDRVPRGKRDCVALRDMIKAIQKDLDDGIDASNKNMTVCMLYSRYINSRANVRKATVQGRNNLMEVLKNDSLGNMSIDKVKLSVAKAWAYRMKEKYSFSTIKNMKRSLNATFHLAIQDDLLRKNPFDFTLTDVIENDTKKKEALTEEQTNALLDFVKKDDIYKAYCSEIIVLVNTGLRVSEMCGLTLSDIDFDNRMIDINHQLKKDKDGYYTEPPKSDSGYRKVPMTDLVYETLKNVIQNRKNVSHIEVDGYKDFVFLNKRGYPMYNAYYTSTFTNLTKKYRKITKKEIPNITPHILRHTFCTNMANKGMTPNNLQYVMGHKNITMTLGYYAHGSYLSAQAEMQRLTA